MNAKKPESDLEDWIRRQSEICASAMSRAISATHLTRSRPAFGQTITPVAGSTLASPEIADWDPEPDYFFHWIRDSAIVMRAVVELAEDAKSEAQRRRWREMFEDFVRFSLTLGERVGANVFGDAERATISRGARKYVRRRAELQSLAGDKWLGEPRFNPDGSLDIHRWSRPQYDGPALRALTCLRYLAGGGPPFAELTPLLRQDLDFTLRHAGRRCIGPWETAGQHAHHYYVALVQLGALTHGRNWFEDHTAVERTQRRLRARLDRHWSERHQVYAAIWPFAGDSAEALLDASTLLGVLDADLPDGPHSAADPRVRATQAAIEAMFAHKFAINRRGSANQAPALGRFFSDEYFGGGAWYVTTLAAAALCYRFAETAVHNRAELIQRGDAFMARVRELTPTDGSMSEQVDATTGEPTSARHLTWSYAAFLSTARLRGTA